MKYWLCEFFKRYGEDENTYHYIFSDKNIKDMKYKGNGDDHKILSQFFLQKITKKQKMICHRICIGLLMGCHL